ADPYGAQFGYSVAVSGDTVIVGSPYEDSGATGVDGDQSDNSARNSGAAYLFVRSGTNWTQQAYLKASNAAVVDLFGYTVAVSGDTVVVGAPFESSNATGVNGDQSDNSAPRSGAAYVFARNGATWSQQAYLKASNTGADDYFGESAAVSGDTIIVSGGGGATVFVRNGTNWTQQAYLVAGGAVAISGDTAVAGGNEAVYVFVRSGTNWSQQAYLKASNTDANDQFGNSVAVSGDRVVVGAFFEASNATRVNGNQSDNSATYSGAVYIFTGSGIGPTLDLVRDGRGGYFLHFTGVPDVTYRLQRAPTVTGPWSAIATNTVPASGLIEYHETAPPPGAAFYRTSAP
ncbi:MAG: FG-GAP repeat protein, partial [Verrucomicrobia bacterium]|nr:FG-GAP repeat protein [Verrucomicrobiota bacterium]